MRLENILKELGIKRYNLFQRLMLKPEKDKAEEEIRAIREVYEILTNTKTPTSDRVVLLEDGREFSRVR